MKNIFLFLLKNSVSKMIILTTLLVLIFKIELALALILSVIILSYIDTFNIIENFNIQEQKEDNEVKINLLDSKETNLDSKETNNKSTDNNKDSDNIKNNDDNKKPPLSISALQSNGIKLDKNLQKMGISAIDSVMGINDSYNVDKKDDKDNTDSLPKELDKKDDSVKKDSKIECTPVIPKLLFTEATNKNYIVRISINSSVINPSGKCLINDHPLEYNLSLGSYKAIKPKKTDKFFEIPGNIIRINKEQKNEKKEINLYVRKGYKVTFISNSGNKSFIGLANLNDTSFVISNDIKKGLLNVSEIRVEKNKQNL